MFPWPKTTLCWPDSGGLAATAALARDKQADLGVPIIHEFVSLAIDFDKLIDNADDLKAFVQAIPGWEKKSLKAGHLLPPIHLTGSESVPNEVHVSIGKIRTLIPLHAGDAEPRRRLMETPTNSC